MRVTSMTRPGQQGLGNPADAGLFLLEFQGLLQEILPYCSVR